MKYIEKKVNDVTFKVEEFDSVLEMMRIDSRREVNQYWKSVCLSDDDIRKSWQGVNTRKEAFDLLSNGWEEASKKCMVKVNKMMYGTRVKNEFFNNVYGFTPVVPLALLNIPTNMIDVRKVQIKSKIITIVYENGGSASISPEELLEAGLKVVNMIIRLEQSGYRCEVKVMNGFFSKDSKILYSPIVTVKRANELLNLKKMMFPIAHPAWFRVIGFDWEDKAPFSRYIEKRGYSFYVAVKKGLVKKDYLEKIIGDNAVYINYETVNEDKNALSLLLNDAV